MLPLYPSHQFWRPRDTHHSWIGLRYSAGMLLVFLMKPPNSSPVTNSCLPTIQMPKGHSEILFQKQCSQSQCLETLILFSSSSRMSSETWISKGKSLTTFFFSVPFGLFVTNELSLTLWQPAAVSQLLLLLSLADPPAGTQKAQGQCVTHLLANRQRGVEVEHTPTSALPVEIMFLILQSHGSGCSSQKCHFC